MDNKSIEKLKYDLKVAVENKDLTKIEEISRILNIDVNQRAYFGKGLTGYPSIDKVWLKYYPNGYYEKANDIPVRSKTSSWRWYHYLLLVTCLVFCFLVFYTSLEYKAWMAAGFSYSLIALTGM